MHSYIWGQIFFFSLAHSKCWGRASGKERKLQIFIVKIAAKEDRKRTTAEKEPGRRRICIEVCILQQREICGGHIKKEKKIMN